VTLPNSTAANRTRKNARSKEDTISPNGSRRIASRRRGVVDVMARTFITFAVMLNVFKGYHRYFYTEAIFQK
jgi:hypothetical protein